MSQDLRLLYNAQELVLEKGDIFVSPQALVKWLLLTERSRVGHSCTFCVIAMHVLMVKGFSMEASLLVFHSSTKVDILTRMTTNYE